jgi:protein tyrosine/serine phosphatase
MAWGFLSGAVLCIGLAGFQPLAQAAVPRLFQVTSEIERGGRPDAQGLKQLAQSGVHTVIDLEDDAQAIQAEKGWASQDGMNWVSKPMSGSATPNDAEVTQILALLQNAKLQPIFVHCHFGEDRTGLIIGLYRVFVQKWTPQQAYQEMLQDGFHPSLTGLDNYFRSKTGYRGRIQEEDSAF